jgi:hypothetical protein
MPPPFPDPLLGKEPPLGEPIGDYEEHILRCAVLNQAISGYICTEEEISSAREAIAADHRRSFGRN